MRLSTMERFQAKVVPGDDGCLLWTGSPDDRGHARFQIAGKNLMAARWLYEESVGPVPEGFRLSPRCGNRMCVSLDHNVPITRRESALRGKRSGPKRGTHCKRGHAYDYSKPNGSQGCRTCLNAGRVESYHKKFRMEQFLPEHTVTRMPSIADIAWAAGLFEGEGSIHIKPSGAPQMALGMKDRDVVERFGDIVECGNMSIGREGLFFTWQISNLAGVHWVLTQFLPYLGERRTRKVEQALAHRHRRRVAA